MNRQEKKILQEAFVLVYRDENDGDWDKGMKILAKLAGIRVPAFEVEGTPIALEEILRGSHEKEK